MILRNLKNWLHLLQARSAAKKFGHPEDELQFIGITGTDGKTTTVSAVYHILSQAGLKVAAISTTEAKIGSKNIDTGFHVTSPDPWELPRYLRMMVDSGIKIAVLETTSQGLDQNRFGDIKFSAGLITNIKEDHLDYHKTWDNYAAAKFKLFRKLLPNGIAVLNADDRKSFEWLTPRLQRLAKRKKLLVINSHKKLITKVKLELDQLSFTYKRQLFQVPIFGSKYNLENIVEVVLLCENLVSLSEIAKALKSFKLPKGRMEVISTSPKKIIVDFAHTPTSFEATLTALRQVLPAGKKIITVFGCAGKRDRGRRYMGKVSANLADLTILTAEDPRNEKLANINNEILATAKRLGAEIVQRFRTHDEYALTSLGEITAIIESVRKDDQKPFIMFDEDSRNSRGDAIDLAIKLARRGDCVLITGKGHETSLSFGADEKEYPWTDQKAVLDIINKASK